jgi:hypothetical protein
VDVLAVERRDEAAVEVGQRPLDDLVAQRLLLLEVGAALVEAVEDRDQLD